jgi:phenylacetic acid degradation operon negative regulatory protein
LPTGPGYGITPKAARRLDAAGARIYRTPTGDAGWDGHFDLITLDPPQHRGARARLVANLGFLGYGAIDSSTWIAPRPGEGVDALLVEAGVRYDRFSAEHVAGVSLVTRAWNLAEIGEAYEQFVARLTPLVSAIGPAADDEQAYAARFTLVHAWRAFLFRDPQLPPDLLPPRWAGTTAAAFFDRHASRLRPAADRYVDQCLRN